VRRRTSINYQQDVSGYSTHEFEMITSILDGDVGASDVW
jgi:hypothetical protein